MGRQSGSVTWRILAPGQRPPGPGWTEEIQEELIQAEINLPTKALGGYENHIFMLVWLGDKGRIWQEIDYF